MIFIPLIMSTGVIGMLDYLGYLFPKFNAEAMGATPYNIVRGALSVGIVAFVVFALYRNVKDVGRLATALWIVMFLTVAAVMLASFTHFDPKLAFDFPPGAFTLNLDFFAGLGSALVVAVYDYLGYNTAAYMAAELRQPGKTIPRAIVFSILGMMLIYFVMNVGIIGVVPWREALVKDTPANKAIASVVVERSWGVTMSKIVTGLIIVTAFGSLFTGLLGGSRVPFNASRNKVFIPIFGRLHPRQNFPHYALIAMGVVTAIGTFFPLAIVIAVLTAVMVLIQCISQIAALIVLRKAPARFEAALSDALVSNSRHASAGGVDLLVFCHDQNDRRRRSRIRLDRDLALTGLGRPGRGRVSDLGQVRENLAVRAEGNPRGVFGSGNRIVICHLSFVLYRSSFIVHHSSFFPVPTW